MTLNWFCWPSYLMSHTQFRILHVIFKCCTCNNNLLWCTLHNCCVMWWNRMAGRISCVCACFGDAMLCQAMYMKRKNGFKDGCAQWYCISAQLVIRKLYSFRLKQMFLCSCDVIENLNISLSCNQSGILRQWTRDVELKKYCITLLEKFGSLS